MTQLVTRRTFLCGLTLGTLSAPFTAAAQQAGKVYRVGVLSVISPESVAPFLSIFLQRLRELGYVAGQDVVLEPRYAAGKREVLPNLAAELVRLPVDVILADGTSSALAAKHATTTIPIVMAASSYPVQFGVVASIARPGGNVTGLSLEVDSAIKGKMLQLLKEIAPRVSRVAVIGWISHASTSRLATALRNELESAGRALGLTLTLVAVEKPEDFESAFAAITDAHADALLVDNVDLNFLQRRLTVDFAARHRLPAVYPYREAVVGGGLMAYGADVKDTVRRAAYFVDKILKGTKPADLPVEQPTKFELVINLKTAKALGLTIPQPLLMRADEIIQ